MLERLRTVKARSPQVSILGADTVRKNRKPPRPKSPRRQPAQCARTTVICKNKETSQAPETFYRRPLRTSVARAAPQSSIVRSSHTALQRASGPTALGRAKMNFHVGRPRIDLSLLSPATPTPRCRLSRSTAQCAPGGVNDAGHATPKSSESFLRVVIGLASSIACPFVRGWL